MTAVVGIINKQCVAIAADSAATVSGPGGRKIYNTANKLFTLSKYHPVAIAIYGGASLMATPWETIVKMYRKQLGEGYFATVEDYKNDFMAFLKSKKYFTTEKLQREKLNHAVYKYLKLLEISTHKGTSVKKSNPLYQQEFLKGLTKSLDEDIASYRAQSNITTDFITYTFEDFLKYFSTDLEKISLGIFAKKATSQILDKVKEFFYLYLTSGNFADYSTGLVFTGFGEDQIYPSIVSISTAEVFDNRLRYADYLTATINDYNTGYVIPFAQGDVIEMFSTGIAPSLEQMYLNTFADFQSQLLQTISDNLKATHPAVAKNIKNISIEPIVDEFKKRLGEVKMREHIEPILNTVSILSKEDLAEMAESLIYLTFMKRRMSADEESVGGPIDVAIISKGDGFIWKRRKHYFEESLNKTFFTNYFNR